MPVPASSRPTILDASGRPLTPTAYAGVAPTGGFLARSRGGYAGARTDRKALKEWTPSLGSPDGDTLPDLPALRARSADLVRNDPIAGGAVNTNCTSVVGAGLTPWPRLDREFLGLSEQEADAFEKGMRRVWQAHAETTAIDVGRRHTFGDLTELALRGALTRGDTFAVRRFVTRKGDVLATRVQLIEADRVSNAYFGPDTDRLAGGVQLDAFGAPDGYWVMNRYLGDLRPSVVSVTNPITSAAADAFSWEFVPAFGPESGERLVLHVARFDRPEQTRGVPFLAPVIETLKQLSRYSEAELMAAVLSAMFTVFVKSETPDDAATDALGLGAISGATNEQGLPPSAPSAGEYQLGAGAIVDLEQGEDITIANPARPNPQFDPFFVACVRQIGVGIEMPYELLIKHFTSSYSASRAALLEAWRTFATRRAWLVRTFCQPVYGWLVAEAVARGLVSAPQFFEDPLVRAAYAAAAWTGPTMGQLNPLDEANAAEKRLTIGLTTLQSETAELTGGDWERNHPQQAKEHNARLAAGLLVVTTPATAAVQESKLAIETADARDAADAPPNRSTPGGAA